ncbi:hypothetical protein AURDEDRAFT_117258 [Auricularia subglabra TFB-10046 SS5]|nr:hypothetical protein AURDEDRAFT_117258 [Auricularia subglabra TFB-10046 SS5]
MGPYTSPDVATSQLEAAGLGMSLGEPSYAEQPAGDEGSWWAMTQMQQDVAPDHAQEAPDYAQQPPQLTFTPHAGAGSPTAFGAGAAWFSPEHAYLLLGPASGDPSPRSPNSHIPDADVPHYFADGMHTDAGCVSGACVDHVQRVGFALGDGMAEALYGGGEEYGGQSATPAMGEIDLEDFLNYDACEE